MIKFVCYGQTKSLFDVIQDDNFNVFFMNDLLDLDFVSLLLLVNLAIVASLGQRFDSKVQYCDLLFYI